MTSLEKYLYAFNDGHAAKAGDAKSHSSGSASRKHYCFQKSVSKAVQKAIDSLGRVHAR